eukprot:gb/GECG01003438.1/.p1 GENE.gb/GECG01003438.1/~~gb/GECG01003438.1/.p1  ORF type:complete len:1150 (+),score=123.71 gb/GECG01003438.1/:1-3450(+)
MDEQGLIYWLNTLGEEVPSALLVSSWTDLADGQVITELTQSVIRYASSIGHPIGHSLSNPYDLPSCIQWLSEAFGTSNLPVTLQSNFSVELIKVGDRFTICSLIGFLKDVLDSLQRKPSKPLSSTQQRNAVSIRSTRKRESPQRSGNGHPAGAVSSSQNGEDSRAAVSSQIPARPRGRTTSKKSVKNAGRKTSREHTTTMKNNSRNREANYRRDQRPRSTSAKSGRAKSQEKPMKYFRPPTPPSQPSRGFMIGDLYDPDYEGTVAHSHLLRQQFEHQQEHAQRNVQETQASALSHSVPHQSLGRSTKGNASPTKSSSHRKSASMEYPFREGACEFLSDWLLQLGVFGGISIKELGKAADATYPNRPEANETTSRWEGHLGQLMRDGVLLSQLSALLASLSGYPRQTRNVSKQSMRRYFEEKKFWKHLKGKIGYSKLCDVILLQRTKVLSSSSPKHAAVLRTWEQNVLDCFEVLKSLTTISGETLRIRHIDEQSAKHIVGADNRIAWELIMDIMHSIAVYSRKEKFTKIFSPERSKSPQGSSRRGHGEQKDIESQESKFIRLEALTKPACDCTPVDFDSPTENSKEYVYAWLQGLGIDTKSASYHLEDMNKELSLLDNRAFNGELLAFIVTRFSQQAIANMPPHILSNSRDHLLPRETCDHGLSARTIGDAAHYFQRKVKYFKRPKSVSTARANVCFALRRCRELLLFSKSLYAGTEYPLCGFDIDRISTLQRGIEANVGENILRGNNTALWLVLVGLSETWPSVGQYQMLEDRTEIPSREGQAVEGIQAQDDETVVTLSNWLRQFSDQFSEEDKPHDILQKVVNESPLLEQCIQTALAKLASQSTARTFVSGIDRYLDHHEFSESLRLSTLINRAADEGIISQKERNALHERAVRFINFPSMEYVCALLATLFKIVNGFSVQSMAHSVGVNKSDDSRWFSLKRRVARRKAFLAQPQVQAPVANHSITQNEQPRLGGFGSISNYGQVAEPAELDTSENEEDETERRDGGDQQQQDDEQVSIEDLPLDMNAIAELQMWLRKNGISTDSWPDSIPGEFSDGLLLAHIVESCERMRGGIRGLTKNPRTTAAKLQNINRVLGVLRQNKRMPLDYLWSDNEIHSGNTAVILKLLEQIRNAYSYHFTPKPLQTTTR